MSSTLALSVEQTEPETFELPDGERVDSTRWGGSALAFVDDTLWIGTPQSGLVSFKRGELRWYHTYNSPLIDRGISYLHAAQDDSLWVGTRRGELHRLKGTRCDQYSATDLGLAGYAPGVEKIIEDKHGDIWIARGATILHLRDGSLEPYHIFDRSEVVKAIAFDERDRITTVFEPRG